MSEFDLPELFAEVNKRLADCEAAPDWTNQDNLLAKVEAIRARAYADIMALGFEEFEISVDVGIVPEDDAGRLFHLAKECGFVAGHSWFEPACKTTGGDITIYFDVE
jgi:hypothetical protein